MWKLYHIVKVGTSLLGGNVGWAGYHAVKAVTWKTRKNNNQNNDTIDGYKVFLKGQDRTSSIESLKTTQNNCLKVKFFGKDTIYTYSPKNYKIIKE